MLYFERVIYLSPVSYSFVVPWLLVGYYPSVSLPSSFPSFNGVVQPIIQNLSCRFVALSLLLKFVVTLWHFDTFIYFAVLQPFIFIFIILKSARVSKRHCDIFVFGVIVFGPFANYSFCKLNLTIYTIIKILLNLFGSLPLKQRAKLRFFFDMCKFLRMYTRE